MFLTYLFIYLLIYCMSYLSTNLHFSTCTNLHFSTVIIYLIVIILCVSSVNKVHSNVWFTYILANKHIPYHTTFSINLKMSGTYIKSTFHSQTITITMFSICTDENFMSAFNFKNNYFNLLNQTFLSFSSHSVHRP